MFPQVILSGFVMKVHKKKTGEKQEKASGYRKKPGINKKVII